MGVPDIEATCWLRQFSRRACEGRLIRAHLIPKQRIKKFTTADVWDARVWVWACGGLTGIGGHHGELDGPNGLRLTQDQLPAELWEFANEYELTWSLQRDYA